MEPARHITIASGQNHGSLRGRQLAPELNSSRQTWSGHSVVHVVHVDHHFKSLPKCAGVKMRGHFPYI
jgi:hypothetical protein